MVQAVRRWICHPALDSLKDHTFCAVRATCHGKERDARHAVGVVLAAD